ncbi:hypothetical protein PQX77_008236 [Marasmius sp. AFHP31]|nr:hypothetical protein PQX77_008295 [Marasmius sp. AFHP31]KAK1228742.1 hypothetical protein PQX77_008236 [Marasmius sp. AFHP31]
MSVAPSPRGDISLQPYYFTSSLYVLPFREDVTTLIHGYHEQYVRQHDKPFALFKKVWCAQGWDWMHFKVFDPPSREAFLNVSLRLFLDRTVKTEATFARVVALFGLYTFFKTQPSGSVPPLHSVCHIPIPYDHYSSLLLLPTVMNSDHLKPLKPSVCYLLDQLVKSETFFILPNSESGPQNPRSLPREVYLDQNTISIVGASTDSGESKKGRPTKRDKVKKAKAALEGIDKWIHKTSQPQSNEHYLLAQPPQGSLAQYQDSKELLLSAMELIDVPDRRGAITNSSHEVLERVKQAQELIDSEERSSKMVDSSQSTGVDRLQAEIGGEKGLLGLVREHTWK